MLDKVKKALGMKPEKVKVLSAEEERRAILEKEKAQATKDKKPWVAVLDTQVNPDNIKNGFFELDWNNEFIEQLLDAGYTGETNEEIVDQWFKDLARNVLEDEGHNTDRGAGFIKTKNLGKDKSEVK